MSEAQAAPKLAKWPFYLADLILSGIAAYVLYALGAIAGSNQMLIALGCLLAAGWGAWLSITPWLVEYRTRANLAESGNLRSTLEQIKDLEKVADLIRQSNAQWQAVQDASGRTVNAAREITDKMKVEADEFVKFIQNAHDQERAGLRLEVEKLRKMEGDWIKVAVQMLDHVFALFRAAERSGQSGLIGQMTQFQNACRDVARRMGLTPFVPTVGEKYDARGHQLPNPPAMIEENATVGDVLATGFTYQGQLLRRSLVTLAETSGESALQAAEEAAAELEQMDEEAVFERPEPPVQKETAEDAGGMEGEDAGEPAEREPVRKEPSSQGRGADPQNELPLL